MHRRFGSSSDGGLFVPSSSFVTAVTSVSARYGRRCCTHLSSHALTTVFASIVLTVSGMLMFCYIYSLETNVQPDLSEVKVFDVVNVDHIPSKGNLSTKSLQTRFNEKKTIEIHSNLTDKTPIQIWDRILESAKDEAVLAWEAPDRSPLVAVEVGVHSPEQCIHAAELGFYTHCFEPSPNSFQRSLNKISRQSNKIVDRINLYNEAAGLVSGEKIKFKATGGTGDHIGEYDMWKMEKRVETKRDGEESVMEKLKRGTIIEVPTIRLDDFIADNIKGNIHLLKIDTQGFEPSIFSGLTKSVENHRINFILFEFWPRGMDLLADTVDQCTGANVLDMLAETGYDLYALALETHPKAPLSGGRKIRREGKGRPFNKGTEAFCRWFFELEEKYPSSEYKFGYWSDFLAVAPGKILPSL